MNKERKVPEITRVMIYRNGETRCKCGNNMLGASQGGPLNLAAPNAWPAFKVLEGNSRYDSFKARMLERLDEERSQMGLGPVKFEETS